jgi:feruloyl-CoA synthase
MPDVRYRRFPFGVTQGVLTQRADSLYLRSTQPLQSHPARMTDRLIEWAQRDPQHPLFAQRDPAQGGAWRYLRYGDALEASQKIGQALLARGLSAERPLVILSDNSLEHAMLALAAMYVGVPFSQISPAYSLVSKDHGKLRHVLQTLSPGLVYANDPERYRAAIDATVDAGIEVVSDQLPSQPAGQRVWSTFAQLLATSPTEAVQHALQATGADTIVKFLFTSGSTKFPKAVINTQRMVCSNQQQIAQSMPALGEDRPVLVDWMPWNHTAGSNHDFFMALYHGGTLYIDEGKPTPALLGQTLRNLREVAPTWYFNVPIGYEAIAREMETDAALRRNFFSRLKAMHYAGAALTQSIQDALYRHAETEYGERVVMTAGLGMTESSPFALFVTRAESLASHIGLPCAGLEVKLTPVGDKLEVRYKGPNITPGYWRNPQATAEALDDEGYFCSGDAASWIDPDNIHLGLKFDGRTTEDFKLSTGTFVSVGPLRASVIAAGAPFIQDVVITGLNRNEVGALILPTAALFAHAGLPASSSLAELARSEAVQAWLQQLLDALAAQASGSASRIASALLLTEPPSLDLGEITDKGSINQRTLLKRREALVADMHEGRVPLTVHARSTPA